MIKFVNAKINLGLNIVRKREDGYHDLETIFYPVGLHNGTPENPQPFCDILEILPGSEETKFHFSGNKIDCSPEKNLVVKAADIFADELKSRDIPLQPFDIHLDKHIPDGAGMGGGSADASFTLKLLDELCGNILQEDVLIKLAGKLGADCPFFVKNHPVYAEGTGDRMQSVNVGLSNKWALIVKPPVFISTKEAFSNVTPERSEKDLRDIISLPIKEWEQAGLKNDFEKSLFPKYPILKEIKEFIRETGALYASMTGSGAALYGIFENREDAYRAWDAVKSDYADDTFSTVCRL